MKLHNYQCKAKLRRLVDPDGVNIQLGDDNNNKLYQGGGESANFKQCSILRVLEDLVLWLVSRHCVDRNDGVPALK